MAETGTSETATGVIEDGIRTEVPATAANGVVIFSGAKKGRKYCVEAICPDNNCWSIAAVGIDLHGPGGPFVGFIVGSGPFVGHTFGSLVISQPGLSGWTSVGDGAVVVHARIDGDIKGAVADTAHSDNIGSMLVSVSEIASSGPPSGKIDEPEDFCITGAGGSISVNSPFKGTSKFIIPIKEKGIINEIDIVTLKSLSHSFANDLKITLQAPWGAQAVLADRVGFGTPDGANGDYSGDYSWKNNGNILTSDATTVPPGTYRSENSFSIFVGRQIAGIWTLIINDLSNSDSGSLGSWELCIKVAETNHNIFVDRPPEAKNAEFSSELMNSNSIDTDESNTWPTIMPTDVEIVKISVPQTGTVRSISFVKLVGMLHSQAGDVQIVLQSPKGTTMTVFHRPGSTSGGTGNTSAFESSTSSFVGANITIVESGQPLLPNSGIINEGVYSRDPGDWPGTSNNFDIGLGDFDSFEGEDMTGVWRVYLFDWESGFFTLGSVDSITLSIDYVSV